MIRRISLFTTIFLVYGYSFFYQEHLFQQSVDQLPFPLPASIQRTALGYLHQLGAEMLYIKTTVFLGGLEPGQDSEDYASSLAKNFSAISTLHPEFVDTYYQCESSMTGISDEYTIEANKILERGMAALPDNWVLPFFVAFNHFFELNQPKDAAVILRRVSLMPSAPAWFGHLASMLAAEGGDIYAGLMWLKGMLAIEEDELRRERYQKDIFAFEQALLVLQATFEYRNRHNRPPPTLDALVPDFLPHIPEFDGKYILSWTPPTLRLLRRDRK